MGYKDTANENFIKLIREKIPQHSKLTNFLVDLLCIEKEAVYRRMREEVPFTFSEVIKISKEMNISLDSIAGTTSPKSRPFQMKLVEYDHPTETDYFMLNEYVELLESVGSTGYSELGFVSNILPLHFVVGYDSIYRLFIMKWIYQFGDPSSTKLYAQIKQSNQLREISTAYLKAVQDITYTYFIFDELLFYYLINDIKYFASIKIISKEEVELLKEDLLNVIREMDILTARGSYPNGNKVHIHISALHFDSNYSYLQADNLLLTLIKSYTLNEVASLDATVFNKMKTWLQSLKRTSVQISESGEIQRLHFFEKQRSYVESL